MRHHLILRVITKLLVGTIFLFALYVQFHGDYSPGGGFQAGVILMLSGMIIQAGWGLIAVKLLIIGVFLFITGPTSTHAVANAALVSGLRPKNYDDDTSDDPDPA